MSRVEQGSIECEVHISAFASPSGRTQESSVERMREKRAASLQAGMCAALNSAVLVDRFPKCVVEVRAEVLEDDGCALAALVTAASASLVDAGVEMMVR